MRSPPDFTAQPVVVNEVGAEEYLKYLEERGPMPVGTVIAKESFAVKDEGKVKKGPLFFMEKVAAGTMPETADWLYLLVSPGGKPMKINAQKACSVCHQDNFGERDGLGPRSARGRPIRAGTVSVSC